MKWIQTKRRKFIGWLQKRAKGKRKDVFSVFKSIAYAYGLYYGGWLVLVLGGLAVLSFTNWLGGPFVVAQVIFFLIAGTVTLILLNVYVFWRTIKGKWESRNTRNVREACDVTETTSKDDAVREGHVIESSEKN